MIPDEKKLVASMKDRPFALIGINSDGAREALKKKLEKEGVTWRSAVDGSTHGPITTEWNVRAWPTTILIDGDGVIRGHDPTDETVEELVKELEAKSKKK